MAQFILLLQGGEFSEYSEEQMQRIRQEYYAWSQKLAAEGRNLGGNELAHSGRILKKKGGQFVDGPFTETKEAVGGFFQIEAKDLEEATTISRECPHLKFKGKVEVREIVMH
ncbi:YciI family protein [bacterium]|nr:YciI family protein [bacterium]